MSNPLTIPATTKGIETGVPLKLLLNPAMLEHFSKNIHWAWSDFDQKKFLSLATQGLDELELMPRAAHIAKALRKTLPAKFADAVKVIIRSMPDPESLKENGHGKALFFFLPYSSYLSEYGLSADGNEGEDPFPSAMSGLYELTQRFTSEFAIRNYLLRFPERTMAQLEQWLNDSSDEVRRLCSEGTRPLLPWGKKLPDFLANPEITAPFLEQLKQDSSLYVRRSVANHLGDLSKENADWVFQRCHQWLDGDKGGEASSDLKWLVRHAVRYHAKREHPEALAIRLRAK